MSIFITSDSHFSHASILTLGDGRPFDSISHHDEMIINNWNSVVGHDDIVIHLGDVAMSHREESLAKLDRCMGRKFLIPGNHDNVSSVVTNAKRERFLPLYRKYFERILPECVILGNVAMSHYPPAEIRDHGDKDRYPKLRPALSDGMLYLHGHTHQLHVETILSNKSRAVSVGVDANDFTPVDIESIDGTYQIIDEIRSMLNG